MIIDGKFVRTVREYKNIDSCDVICKFEAAKIGSTPEGMVTMGSRLRNVKIHAVGRRPFVISESIARAIAEWFRYSTIQEFEITETEYSEEFNQD